MWTIGDQSSELINYLCSATSNEYGVREALIEPALALVVGLGVWAYERARSRKAQVHSAPAPVQITD